jgi:hypothetical protein
MISKVARLRLIRDGLRGLRHDLAQTAGSDRISEVTMLDTLTEAIEGLIWEAQRPRSRPYVSGNPPATVRSAALEAKEAT